MGLTKPSLFGYFVALARNAHEINPSRQLLCFFPGDGLDAGDEDG